MRNFLKVIDGIDTLPILLQLHEHPELWDEYRERTVSKESPHYGIPDIWLRYRDRAELTEPKAYIEPHRSVWYPSVQKVPAARRIAHALAPLVEATAIGGVFITKIPPGGEVRPHDDAYSWHANEYSCKVYVPLRTNLAVVNRVEDEAVVMKTGEAWIFNNLVTHSVENHGDEERITLICCYRRED